MSLAGNGFLTVCYCTLVGKVYSPVIIRFFARVLTQSLLNTRDLYIPRRGQDLDIRFLFVFSQKVDSRKASLYLFSPKKLARLFLMKDVKISPDRKVIKFLPFDNLFPPL